MVAVKPKSQLSISPEIVEYRAQDDPEAEQKLLRVLDSHVKYTQKHVIAREQDVLLHKNMCVRGVFRLSAMALQHICSRLAPGLHQAIMHISGMRTDKRASDRNILYSDEVAAGIINRLIKLRFNNLRGYRLVLDHQAKIIDGLIGRNYEFFANREFYQAAMDFVRSQWPDAEFYEAVVQGRRLLFRIRNPYSLSVNLPNYGPEIFHQGFHFSNAEVGGFALRAANVLIRKSTGGIAISPFVNGGKVCHIQSQNFFQQLQSLFSRVARKTLTMDTLRPLVVRLATTRLGVVTQGKVVESQQEFLAGQLQRRGLTKELADAVITRTTLLGEASPTTSLNLAGADLSRDRTGFDIFCALTKEAKDQRLKRREQLEQVAYELLSGTLVLCTTL